MRRGSRKKGTRTVYGARLPANACGVLGCCASGAASYMGRWMAWPRKPCGFADTAGQATKHAAITRRVPRSRFLKLRFFGPLCATVERRLLRSCEFG